MQVALPAQALGPGNPGTPAQTIWSVGLLTIDAAVHGCSEQIEAASVMDQAAATLMASNH